MNLLLTYNQSTASLGMGIRQIISNTHLCEASCESDVLHTSI